MSRQQIVGKCDDRHCLTRNKALNSEDQKPLAVNCIERGLDDVAGALRETASQERKQGAVHKGLPWITRAGPVEGDGAVVSLAVFAPDAMGWPDRG